MAHFISYTKLLKGLLLALVVSSCTTEIDWDKQIDSLINGQSYVIPIGETTMTLNDIIEQFDSIHFVEPGDNYIFLNYKDTLKWDFRKTADFKNLVTVQREYDIPEGVIPSNTTFAAPDFNDIISLDFNSLVEGQHIDRTELNSAKVELIVTKENFNIDPSNIRVTTLFNSNELAFVPGGDVSRGAGSTFILNPIAFDIPEVITLNPLTLYSPNNLSTLNITIRVEVIAGNSPIISGPNSKIKIKYKLFDVDTKVFYGVIKPTIANDVEEKIVDMTEYIMQLPSNGVFKIAEPIIKFDLYNNSGVKINLAIDTIKAYRSNDASFAPVYAKFDGAISSSKVIERVQNFGEAPAKSTFYLDHTLSNGDISHFFDSFPLPDRLMYKFEITNARSASDPLDFATPTSNLTAHVDVKIPLKLNAGSSFELVDTLENIDMNKLIDLKVVDQMMLILKVTNNLPLKGKLSLKFLDDNKMPISNLKMLADSLIQAPLIDDNGLVVGGQSVDSDLKIIVASSQLSKLRLAKSLVYTIKIESEENRKITLQKENFIKLKLGKFSQAE